MSGTARIIGVPPEVMEDPRVADAVSEVEHGKELAAARAITAEPLRGIEKYGVKLRPLSLVTTGPLMARIMTFKPPVPDEYQLPVLLFLLGAPLPEVFAAMDSGSKGPDGCYRFLERCFAWCSESGIPNEVGEEVATAVAETFAIAAKLTPAMGGDQTEGGPGLKG